MAYTVAKGDTLGAIAKKLGVKLSDLTAANPQIKNINKISVGQQINTPGGGAAPAAAPAGVDLSAAMSQYGNVAAFAQTNPELNGILQQAIAGQWDSARFQKAISDSGWWKGTNENVRNLQIQQATDPASYNQTVGNKASTIGLMAQNMGLDGIDANGIATMALQQNWSDAQIQQYVGLHGQARMVNGGYTAQAGEVQAHMDKTVADYGMPMTDSLKDIWVRAVLSGQQTLGGLDEEVKNWAINNYGQFKAQLQSGQTLRDIADPYIAQMAQTLEMPDTNIKLSDGWVQKALTGAGSGQAMNLTDFTRQLKDDPRWQKTTNAKNTAYDTLSQVGHDFGFLGNS